MESENTAAVNEWDSFDEERTALDFPLIGARLRKARNDAGFSQEAAAEKLEVNQSHLSNIECGRAHPSLSMLVRLCNVYHLNIDYFLWDQYESDLTENDSEMDEMKTILRRMTDSQRSALLKIARTFVQ